MEISDCLEGFLSMSKNLEPISFTQVKDKVRLSDA